MNILQLICSCLSLALFILLVATISFNQSMYSVGENEGSVQVVLIFNSASSIDITVEVADENDSAIGKTLLLFSLRVLLLTVLPNR